MPTATVRFMSLIENLPSDGNWEKTSTTIGFYGVSFTIAESPDLKNFGSISVIFLVFLSNLHIISVNLQGTWAVWQSRIGV